MRRPRARHPNRAGLRVVQARDTDQVTAMSCRCPTRTVAGTRWAYDRQLGWHDPDEHGDWQPPYWPTA